MSEGMPNIAYYRELRRQHGLGRALFAAAYRVVNHAVDVAIWNGVVLTMDTVDEKFLEESEKKNGRFFEPAELESFAKDPENELTAEFMRSAFARGDRCFGFVVDGALASYGWYSTKQTEAGEGLVLHFDPSYVYMYKGFTHPKFRGQRLHAIGMAAALAAYANEGAKGLISYVDSTNFSSLKSCYRMGYKTFGRVGILKTKRGYVTRASSGCGAYAFGVDAVPVDVDALPSERRAFTLGTSKS
jgi:hypothetical protein